MSLRDFFKISRRENILVEQSVYIENDVPYGTLHTGFMTFSTYILSANWRTKNRIQIKNRYKQFI